MAGTISIIILKLSYPLNGIDTYYRARIAESMLGGSYSFSNLKLPYK
jgi:hypothetical protein